MALTEEQTNKAIQELKAKQAHKDSMVTAKKPDKKVESPAKPSADNDVSLKAIMDKMNELQNQISNKDKENQKLRQKLNKKFDGKTYLQTQEAMNEVLRDSDPRYFVKHYDIKIDGQKDIEFDIKMHAPSAIELSAIEQELTDMTNGRAEGFNIQSYTLFKAIAYFKVVGEICPDWFKDPEKCYRWDIVVNTYVDFSDWENSFRYSQRQ